MTDQTVKPKLKCHCSDCGAKQKHFHYPFYKANKPKCNACGGAMISQLRGTKKRPKRFKTAYDRHNKKMGPPTPKKSFADIQASNERG